jgi:tetratricopeptide (TPR) repeat protein
MPERAGGFERKEIDDGFRALASVQSAQDLDRLIDTMPVLRSPIFHAYLRQYRFNNLAEFEKIPRAYQAFMEVYDSFFTRLHFQANYAQSRSEPQPRNLSAEPVRQPVPPFFEAVRNALGSAVPAPDGPTFHPQSGAADIRDAIARLTKKLAALPPWEPSPGTLWSGVVVACGRCHQPRLAIVPYCLDILGQPAVLDSLRSGAYEWPTCPHCPARTVLPLRTWISEEPSPSDPLGAICTLCRVRETEIIFRPPPGTERKAEDDRILEIRLDMMIRQLGIKQPSDAGVVLSNGIAYCLEELVWRIDRSLSAAGSQIDYQDTMAAIYQKLLSGLLNWQDAERQIRRTVAAAGHHWPLKAAEPVGDPMKALIVNLVAEACAEVQHQPLDARVCLAGLVSQCYAILGETARARIALARARDLAAKLPGDASTTAALQETEAEILRAEGRRDAAARIHPKSPKPEGDDPASRLERARVLQNEGLELRAARRIRDAIETLGNGVSLLRRLVNNDTDDVRHALSGTLANLALVYGDCAQNLEALAALAVKPVVYANLPKKALECLKRLGSAEALLAMQTEMLGPVKDLLKAEFGHEPDAPSVRARAIALYREAISEARDYEYLCIQCRGLASLLMEAGDMDGAAAAARDCLSYAARLRSYKFIGAANWLLAEIARERGDAPAALEALEKCMEAQLRETVRAAASDDTASAIACEALRVALLGADPLAAILIAESSKAITTSVSLIRAAPLQGALPDSLKDLSRKLETLQLRNIWEPTSDLQRQIETVQDAMEDAHRELAVRDPRAASWHDATDLDISRPAAFRRLLARLGGQTTYAGFVMDRGALFAYALWPEDQILQRVDLPAGGLTGDDPNALASLLFQPLASRLEKLEPEDRLIISPSRELQSVPFSLLPFQGKPLCAHAIVTVVNGSGVFEACAGRPALMVRSAVALGAPARPDAPELPGAAMEIEQITARLESAGIRVRPELTGPAATVPALAARVLDADLIHFACHADVKSNGENARLLLAPAPLAKDSGVLSEDRILTDLRLKPSCHVNLAACRSAVSAGEGEYYARGLATAFLVAGASSVLATLWPLPDGPAAVFQSAYYDRIAQGQSPAVALAATQRAAIGGELGSELQLPQNFAGYVLYGVAAEVQQGAASA